MQRFSERIWSLNNTWHCLTWLSERNSKNLWHLVVDFQGFDQWTWIRESRCHSWFSAPSSGYKSIKQVFILKMRVLFVFGGAAYNYHSHNLDFFNFHCIQENKLLFSVANVEHIIFQVCFRTFGIMGKLIMNPPLKLVEELEGYIFSLSDTWFFVIEKLENFKQNVGPPMEYPEIFLNGLVKKNLIYDELLKDMMNTVPCALT